MGRVTLSARPSFPGGANFSVYSRGASSVELLLFDARDDASPARVIDLDAASTAPITTGTSLCPA